MTIININDDRCNINDKNKIQLRVYKLRQQSPDYHEEQYYLNLANHQIKIEQAIVDNYKWYDPRRWISSIEYKYLKMWAQQLKKCSLLNIIEQLAILSVLIGAVTFVSEAERRHEERITDKMKNLLEVIYLNDEPQNVLISSYLQRLNDRDIALSKFFYIRGYQQLAMSIWKKEKIYVFDEKKSKCKQILKIQLWLPRWEAADFVNLKLPENLHLEGVELCNASLVHATLNKVILNYAMLANANLQGAKLENAELKNSDLRESSLVWADLTDADLTDANLTGAELQGAKLENAELKNSDLRESFLVWADLTGADLTGADLTGADLTGANLTGADLTGANLREIKRDNRLQLKSACNWDKAFYVYRQMPNKSWELDKEDNQQHIEHIKQDKASDPQTPVDCSKWN